MGPLCLACTTRTPLRRPTIAARPVAAPARQTHPSRTPVILALGIRRPAKRRGGRWSRRRKTRNEPKKTKRTSPSPRRGKTRKNRSSSPRPKMSPRTSSACWWGTAPSARRTSSCPTSRIDSLRSTFRRPSTSTMWTSAWTDGPSA
uniref:(northern house mosquito) hypothetical protein n=1 Tax=Culex pipiens TaxID=7175 RepID=A0A8D8A8V4_CULPI